MRAASYLLLVLVLISTFYLITIESVDCSGCVPVGKDTQGCGGDYRNLEGQIVETCMTYCVPVDYVCCGCNGINGVGKCLACPPGSTCVKSNMTTLKTQLQFWCVSK
ncbi:hypothetical protein CYY_005796 [Polysphondylium violaceum]|uniref:Uncharacterized protein n=1 Tax=Polysphondylium violaceum TaxID=133409 RepID=A0A8J4URY3_9MYCE|nr:hypothetical protein CYY_005796 [Polysphondylium violaceum]